jgi:glucose-1-phosphate cytidylyltransferase
MKVVLFCGGLGLRIRGLAEAALPKPLVPIGNRPILWHVMRYYAHFGHRHFVLCLGYGGEAIRQYIAGNPELGGWHVELVDTGLSASIGERLTAVRSYVVDDEVFLCNYADGLTDLHLPDLIAAFAASGKLAACLCVRPWLSYHFVRTEADGTVLSITEAEQIDHRINGGYFVLTPRIFDYFRDGEDLVAAPFRRLVDDGMLLGYRYDGFWRSMDTFKDKQALEDLAAGGAAPWEVWRSAATPGV